MASLRSRVTQWAEFLVLPGRDPVVRSISFSSAPDALRMPVPLRKSWLAISRSMPPPAYLGMMRRSTCCQMALRTIMIRQRYVLHQWLTCPRQSQLLTHACRSGVRMLPDYGNCGDAMTRKEGSRELLVCRLTQSKNVLQVTCGHPYSIEPGTNNSEVPWYLEQPASFVVKEESLFRFATTSRELFT